ncbi:hypothetical protein GJU40_08465 [Bacillus lacus]|uniref:Flagellar protein n=1 Tax=Metabacillus lacus TaxID=1983721 RepID=A0A7X2IYK8_9BACI|nr:TIGR03826 family flagellar region protein [Metabacillus lacus]MRX72183.1 hypothetical protein [Metabacillus lacus]
MNNLENCPQCFQVFVKNNLQTVCNDCFQEEEQLFQRVYIFLKKRNNRSSTLSETSEATEVKEDLILKFIRQGRIQLSNFPNLGYPCEKCGTLIREGKLCCSCKSSLTNQIRQMEREEEHKKERNELSKSATFYANKPKSI